MSCDTTIDLVIGGKIDAVKAAMEWQAKKTKKWQEIQNSNEDRNEEWLSQNGFKDHREYVTGEWTILVMKRTTVTHCASQYFCKREYNEHTGNW